jgi:hypothetical protein
MLGRGGGITNGEAALTSANSSRSCDVDFDRVGGADAGDTVGKTGGADWLKE